SPRSIPQTQIRWTPQRHWSSPRSQTRYPVAWHLTLENRHFEIQPLMDDQELDGRRSTGALYWEGAVRLLENGQTVGRGYLELTGYGKALVMGAG
ncbi:MAG: lipocalin family protein, partial [Zoogloea sp.]